MSDAVLVPVAARWRRAFSRLALSTWREQPQWARVLLLAVPLGMAAFVATVWITSLWGPGDAIVYLAAGQRLNAGHPLYSLLPGDLPVGYYPPYWTVPLLSPPLIGVLWRPLALLDPVAVVTLWWLAMAAVTVGSVALLYRRAFVATGLLMLPVSIPVAVLALSGNVDALRLAGCLAIWWLVRRDRDLVAGGIAGLLVALKLTPLPLVWWLLLIGRPRAVIAASGAALACLALTLIGAGLGAHVDYLGVIFRTVDVGTSEWTVAGLARDVGVPATIARYLPTAVALVAVVAMIPLRKRPGAAWALAVVGMVLGAPAAAAHTFAGLLAAVAPLAWPLGSAREAPVRRAPAARSSLEDRLAAG